MTPVTSIFAAGILGLCVGALSYGGGPAATSRWLRNKARRRASGVAARTRLGAVVAPTVVGAGAGLLAFLTLNLLVPAITLGIMGAGAAYSLGPIAHSRRRSREREALISSIDLLCQLLPAGNSVRQAVKALAESGPMELRAEFTRIVERQQVVSLEAALAEAQSRLRQPLFTLLCTALVIGSRSGGRLAPLLEELSRSSHQLEATQRQLKAEQAQGRLGALVIAVMPIGLLAVLRAVNPQYLAPYAQYSGQLLLSGLLVLVAIGYLWMLRILRFRDPDGLALSPLAPSPGATANAREKV